MRFIVLRCTPCEETFACTVPDGLFSMVCPLCQEEDGLSDLADYLSPVEIKQYLIEGVFGVDLSELYQARSPDSDDRYKLA